MRALSPEEAEALRSCGQGVFVVPGSSLEATLDRVEARGLLGWRDTHEGGRWIQRSYVTDLGRLALRVAVAIPSVQL